MKEKQRNVFLHFWAVSLFFSLTVIFFFPIETYMLNIVEFEFPLKHVLWILLVTSLAVSLFLSALLLFFDKGHNRICRAGIIVLFTFSLCYYIQGLFLNGYVASVSGESVWFERDIKILNLVIWAGIAAVIILLKWKYRNVEKAVVILSSVCVLIQSVGFFSLFITTPKTEQYKNYYITSEGEFELSDDNNVVVFVLDTCDNRYVEATLEKYPDLFEPFNGFVYYPNSITTYSRTYPSIPYLLTGQPCYFDVPPAEYIENAWENSLFLESIKAAGADIRIYTHPFYLSERGKNIIDNYNYYDGDSLSALFPSRLIKMMLKISAYKGLPYYFKARFFYYPGEINQYVINYPEKSGFFDERDDLFYQSLKETGISVSRDFHSAFRFYHLWGTHPGHPLNSYGEMVEDEVSAEESLKGDFRIIETYLQYLKDE